MTRAHVTASMQDIDMESPHVAPHEHDPNPVLTLHRMDTSKFRGGNAPPVDERPEGRVYCPDPNCSRSYLQFRSEKRHAVLDHHMRYDNRTKSLIPFESHEAFQIAYAKNKEAKKSGQKRRAEEGTGETPLFVVCHPSKDRRREDLK